MAKVDEQPKPENIFILPFMFFWLFLKKTEAMDSISLIISGGNNNVVKEMKAQLLYFSAKPILVNREKKFRKCNCGTKKYI